MPLNPVEAEAIGQEFITADYGGAQWRIPLDVDSWPCGSVLNSLQIAEKRVKPNHFALISAMRELLGDQWDHFTTVAKKRGDLVAASNVLAAAAGMPADTKRPLDVVFGAIPRLLLDIAMYESAVEATLGDLGVDYRDRWRFDAGRRRLTLRQIHVRLSYAPFDCALQIAKNGGKRPHSGTELLLMDLWERAAGEAHPSRGLPPAERAKREARKKAHSDYRARQKTKQSRTTAALDIARANAQREAEREVAHA